MLDLELQKSFVEGSEHPLSHSERYNEKNLDERFKLYPFSSTSGYYGLKSFIENKCKCKKCVILTKMCALFYNLNYISVLSVIKIKKQMSKIRPFYDSDYLKGIDGYCAILLDFEVFVIAMLHLGYTPKEIKRKINKGEDCFFCIENYKSFLEKRQSKIQETRLKNRVFYEEIKIDRIPYYTNSNIDENKIKCTSNAIKNFVRENIEKATRCEKLMCGILDNYNIEYEFQKPVCLSGKTYIMDFYLPKYGICIEIDGEYHNKLEQMQKDIHRTNEMSKHGILTIRFSNEEVMLAHNNKICKFNGLFDRILSWSKTN